MELPEIIIASYAPTLDHGKMHYAVILHFEVAVELLLAYQTLVSRVIFYVFS